MAKTATAFFIALFLLAQLSSTASAAEPKAKSAKDNASPGQVAWFDITTTSLAKSQEFYGKLFDWKFIPVAGTDQAIEITSGGTSIGTIRVAEGDISSNNGMVYIKVENIELSCKKAKELGGTIPDGFPFNLPDNKGSIAVVVDPFKHPIGMYCKTPVATKTPPAK